MAEDSADRPCPRSRPSRRGYRARRQFDVEFLEAEIAIDRGEQADKAGAFGLDLVFGAEDMRIVLHEARTRISPCIEPEVRSGGRSRIRPAYGAAGRDRI